MVSPFGEMRNLGLKTSFRAQGWRVEGQHVKFEMTLKFS